MSFAVMDADTTKGIKHLDADGNETLEDDDPYVFIRYEASAALPGGKRSRTQVKDEDPTEGAADDSDASDGETAAPNPEVAIAALQHAQDELAVMIDLLGSVASQKTVSLQYVDVARSRLDTFRRTAAAVQGARRRLAAGAARLREAAQQLREQSVQRSKYVRELAQLQAFWRLQPSSESDATFHVLLAFPAALAPNRALPKATATPPVPPFEHIRVTPGFSGSVVTSVPPEKGAPTVQGDAAGSAQPAPSAIVSVGVQEVHAFLLQRLRQLVARAVEERCAFELAQSAPVNFTRHAVHAVLQQLDHADASAGSKLRLFRPMLRRLMLTQLVPGKAVTADAVLVPRIMAALKRRHLAAQIKLSLKEQIRQYPGAALITFHAGGAVHYAARAQGHERGSFLVKYHSGGVAGDHITVDALPRGSSALHEGDSLQEFQLGDVSLAEVAQLAARYWGVPAAAPQAV